jgi:hypothetical protein
MIDAARRKRAPSGSRQGEEVDLDHHMEATLIDTPERKPVKMSIRSRS